ncbi:hypothetical protein DL89DRAFT_264869 [Linderina pennispora]|uniref:Uncharacterized protein n=1 Tax=Linderina pennispora TaxID=61395 RepID=A0A1Y1WGI3_9FUNG|nr:uncharacterized protein DL89DRAFT_264869 [Linderina pennispora]ORX72660.1 hypothetical protein DL89DRAFT_264869 [Linderina pennispora]
MAAAATAAMATVTSPLCPWVSRGGAAAELDEDEDEDDEDLEPPLCDSLPDDDALLVGAAELLVRDEDCAETHAATAKPTSAVEQIFILGVCGRNPGEYWTRAY